MAQPHRVRWADSTVGVIGDAGASLRVNANLARLTEAVNRDASLSRPSTTPTPTPPPEPVATPSSPRAKRLEVPIEVEVISSSLVNVPSPVAVVGRYLGLPLQGTASEVDDHLHNWLKRSFEAGIASSRLGELNFFPLERVILDDRA